MSCFNPIIHTISINSVMDSIFYSLNKYIHAIFFELQNLQIRFPIHIFFPMQFSGFFIAMLWLLFFNPWVLNFVLFCSAP